MKEYAIEVNHVSMLFRLNRERVDSVKEYFIRLLTRKLTYTEFWALKDVSFKVEKGDRVGVMGFNGAGKSTTIKMLSCLIRPTYGDALVMERSIVSDSVKVKEVISVSPQETSVAPNLAVRENLEFIAGVFGADKRKAKEKADSAEKKLEEVKKTSLDSKTIDDAVNAKMELLHNAEKANVEVKADMSDMDIKKAIITSAFPNAKFDGKDDVYIQARYDATVEMLEERNDAKNRQVTSDLPPEAHADENDARNRMIERMKNHGQEAK